MTVINYNKYPYYDDFDADNNFLRVMFRPERALQARELTQIQSILQNQIGKASAFYAKHGDQIIGGELKFTTDANYLKITSIDNDSAANVFTNQIVVGTTTGIRARIHHIEDATTTDYTTFYVEYKTNSQNDHLVISLVSGTFTDGETVTGGTSGATGTVVSHDGTNLILNRSSSSNKTSFQTGETIVSDSGNATVTSINEYYSTQESFLPSERIKTVDTDTVYYATIASQSESVGKGSLAFIEDGIYFVDDFYVQVDAQTIALDKYDTSPTYKVGLKVDYNYVTYATDTSLLDNAQGTPNYQAPGADRLKATLTLTKRSVNYTDQTNFIELIQLNSGLLETQTKNFKSPVLINTLAQRTFDQSGNFTVKPFKIDVREHKSTETDAQGRAGVYDSGNSDDLAIGLSDGKAYVKGFEYDIPSVKYVTMRKARDEKTESGTVDSINAELGNYIYATGVYQLPQINTDSTSEEKYPIVELMNDAILVLSGTDLSIDSIDVNRYRHFLKVVKSKEELPYPSQLSL
ncbi:MAG: DUF4815 domain-containing protein [bacterium]